MINHVGLSYSVSRNIGFGVFGKRMDLYHGINGGRITVNNMKRSADKGIMTHLLEVGPLTKLIFDLRKQALGYESDPITCDRLNECDKCLQQIMRCKTQGLYK